MKILFAGLFLCCYFLFIDHEKVRMRTGCTLVWRVLSLVMLYLFFSGQHGAFAGGTKRVQLVQLVKNSCERRSAYLDYVVFQYSHMVF